MGRNRNLFQQFNNAITSSFNEGTDKHGYKRENGFGDSDKIFSYSSLNNMRDFARNFSNYLKENFSDIKRLDQVREEHLQSFLNDKNEKGCSQNTLNLYKSNLDKLENLINKRYEGCNWDFKDKVKTPTSAKQFDPARGAGSTMTEEDYNKLKEYLSEHRSTSGDALLAQDSLGFRVEELAQLKVGDVDLEKGELTFNNTKGGKEIKRDISNVKDIFKRNMEGKNPEDKIFNIKSDSINQQLSRVQDKLGLEKHSNHNIRRLLAQQKFNECRNSGMSKQEALDTTSNWLNHNAGRNDLLAKSYIKNIW